MHIVAQSFRRIDDPLSSALAPPPAVAEVVIDELDDECMDDIDEMLLLLIFGDSMKPGAMEAMVIAAAAVLSVEHICRLFSNGYNDADDADVDVENIRSADVSSSVNGSERVR